MVHGSTVTGSVPLILALGVRPFWVWGSVLRGRSHFSDPLLTLTLRVLRCLQTQWLVTGVGLGHKQRSTLAMTSPFWSSGVHCSGFCCPTNWGTQKQKKHCSQ